MMSDQFFPLEDYFYFVINEITGVPSSSMLITFKNQNFWYQPHYISGLIGLVVCLIYLAFYNNSITGQSPILKYFITACHLLFVIEIL